MPEPFLRLNSSLFLSNQRAMLVMSTSIKVVACGAVRLVRTMCSAVASRMRVGVTSSSSAPAMVGAGAAGAGVGDGGAETAGAVGAAGGGAVVTGAVGCWVDREAT